MRRLWLQNRVPSHSSLNLTIMPPACPGSSFWFRRPEDRFWNAPTQPPRPWGGPRAELTTVHWLGSLARSWFCCRDVENRTETSRSTIILYLSYMYIYCTDLYCIYIDPQLDRIKSIFHKAMTLLTHLHTNRGVKSFSGFWKDLTHLPSPSQP